MTPSDTPLWQLLQVSDVLDLEFATALAELVPVLAWEPMRAFMPWLIRAGQEPERLFPASHLRIRGLPLLRGFARFPISSFADVSRSLMPRLFRQTPHPERSPLLCTTPYFAPLAEQWPGPVIYWLTDLIAEYAGANRDQVRRLDRRLCAAATLVCPNSQRIQAYLIEQALCDPAKIQIVPNATRAANVLAHPSVALDSIPPQLASIPRPVAGIIGNLAGNMDWLYLRDIIAATPELSWVFVGPTTMAIPSAPQREARRDVMLHPRTHFVGRQPYGDLASFARAFDVAVLPYLRCEPTYSGSSTRFYEHLAACRPMVATSGLEELTRKPPLLYLADTAPEAIATLEKLRAQDFDDGLTEARWLASLEATWQARAQTVKAALLKRLSSTATPTAQTPPTRTPHTLRLGHR